MTGKKRIFAGMGILLGVLVGVQGTAAYQSAYDKAVNIVTPGNISSEIGEDFPNPPTIVPDKDITLKNTDSEIWIYGDDGFYYYKKILREGESTTQLCTGFLIDHARVEKKYWKLLNEFQIQVYQESVEARPFDNYQKAWEYYTGEL